MQAGNAEGAAPMRSGVVDVGSNSVRFVVFDGPERCPSYFFNEKVLCGLGRNLSRTGVLDPEGRVRALTAIRRFAGLADAMKLDRLVGIATAAVREAEDGPDFVEDVRRVTGLALTIASGDEEARLAAQGVLMGMPAADGLVVDIGGASMEIAEVSGGAVGRRMTSPLGPLALADIADGKRAKHIARTLERLRDAVDGKGRELLLVGGSWRAIAQIDMQRRSYPLPVLHGYRMPAEEALETARWIAEREAGDLSTVSDSSPARLSLVPMAAEVLAGLVETFAPSTLTVSAYGLREGTLYSLMPGPVRRADPLLAAARDIEANDARMPGFGDVLADWIAPLFEDASADDRRLIRAACLLHDVNWRTHPDFRPLHAFEAPMRASLAGVDHPDRIFIGACLAYRYKSPGKAGVNDALMALLPEDRMALAEQAGRAIRLGAMLSGTCADTLADSRIAFGEGTVELTLGPIGARLSGEVVEKRLARLARSWSRDPVIHLKD
ncbi:MAG: exopolyphosphatase [Rubricella sp.]